MIDATSAEKVEVQRWCQDMPSWLWQIHANAVSVRMLILFAWPISERSASLHRLASVPRLPGAERMQSCLVVGQMQTPGVNGLEGTAALRPDLSPNKDVCIN